MKSKEFNEAMFKRHGGHILALTEMDRLIRTSTEHQIRVSDSAAEELRTALEMVGDTIAKDAAKLSKHSKKKTICGKDIRLAYENWRRLK